MAMITMHSVPALLTEQELMELNEAEKKTIVFDEDSPELTEGQLKQFHKMQDVTIRISPETFKQIKELQVDVSVFLTQLIDAAIQNQELVKKCI